MTSYEQNLYNQMLKLARTVNSRLIRLEKETGIKNSFAAKRLTDYLSSESLNVITKSGRVSKAKGLTALQMKAINKELRQFLRPETVSTVKQARQYRKYVSKQAGKPVTYKQAESYYQGVKQSREITEYFDSDFWDIARESVSENWTEEHFSDVLKGMLDESYFDEDLKESLKELYEYTRDIKMKKGE